MLSVDHPAATRLDMFSSGDRGCAAHHGTRSSRPLPSTRQSTESLPQLLHLRTQETPDPCGPVLGSVRTPRPAQRPDADLRADIYCRLLRLLSRQALRVGFIDRSSFPGEVASVLRTVPERVCQPKNGFPSGFCVKIA